MGMLNTIANALHAGISLTTTVKYSYVIDRPWVGADSCFLNVPDGRSVVRVIIDKVPSCDVSLRSLTSNRGSRVKRLAIPPILWPNPSRE